MDGKDSIFPLYLMITDGKREWVGITEAGLLYDRGFTSVSIGGYVIGEGGSQRKITDQERETIERLEKFCSKNK